MKKISAPKKMAGTLVVPPDKSITHRSILLSSLAKGTSHIKNPLPSDDCLSTLSCIEHLGCKVEKRREEWVIEGHGLHSFKEPAQPLDCGNSGTTMRLLSGILAAQSFSSVLTGDDSLSKRPMKRIADPLNKMGAHLTLTNGKFPPIKVKGNKNLKPISWDSPVSSAQVKSAVLLAGLHTAGTTTFSEPSRSRDHSEKMLEASGVELKKGKGSVSISGPQEPKAMTWEVPRDFSSAAFFIVAALLLKDSNLTLPSVNLNPTRIGLLDVLVKAGAAIEIQHIHQVGGEDVGDIVISKQSLLQPFDLPKDGVPRLLDEIPILAVAATQAHGTTTLSGLQELRVKESDRLAVMAKNLSLMGAHIKEMADGLLIQGPSKLKGAPVSTMGDHRIAMSLAVAGLLAEGETTIQDDEAVAISFPNFWTQLESVCQR